MAKKEPVLVAAGLTKSYEDLVALSPLNLTLRRGEMAVLVGHNGSGKSTFLGMSSGLVEPTDGTLLVANHEAGSFEARAATSYLPDQPVLYDDLSVLEHLEYIARLHGVEDWEHRAHELLDRLGLSHRADGLPSRFSRGLRQKTAIALALVRPFDLLLVDEPFVGLDPQGRDAMVALLAEAHHGGAAVIVATHQLDFVQRAERCLALRDGELVFDGPARGANVDQLVLGEHR
ncbi:MAG TPA: ABC transporter ATP-binding protein [Acidimicrobiales bacterium]|nr:ABC transporter ATP-binding protein [Acidimicrobiales bacterium]